MTALRTGALLFTLFAAGCGSNTPEIPSEYLNGSGGSGGTSSLSYPAGPYGTTQGTLIKNYRFNVGWSDPKAVGYDLERLDAEPLELASFYAPTGEDADGQPRELLLLNTAAIWCQACRIEHEELDTRLAQYGPRGVVIFSTLFQDAQSRPATTQHLKVWAQQFEVGFPFALDPEYQMGDFARAETAPLNLVVDLKTMEILLKVTGEGLVWPFIEAELAARGR